MVVDDDPVVLRVLRVALQGAGYAVVTHTRGDEALQSLLRSPPDVLITDIEMPGLTGRELCTRIRAEMRERMMPIFVTTSRTEVEHRGWSEATPGLIFIEKPFSARRLIAQLAQIFDQAAVPVAGREHVE